MSGDQTMGEDQQPLQTSVYYTSYTSIFPLDLRLVTFVTWRKVS
ncbi:hypothetical protein HNR39_004240 [Glaciimonas immobilis]|uniref:Uncharacterized protein n=1 Tax=Glaciimonas immobilis TaxID=728004 RepID=A0A840RZU4_9BURK|nr:hypothetical protein [Glaciimonas immobilis]